MILSIAHNTNTVVTAFLYFNFSLDLSPDRESFFILVLARIGILSATYILSRGVCQSLEAGVMIGNWK